MASDTATDLRVERKPKLSERVVVGAARRRCSAARFAPGQKLPTESQLTETFGVSRTVIREAIATLAADGLVEARQGAGVFVIEPSDAGLRRDQRRRSATRSRSALNVLEVRMGIEIESAGLAALRRNARAGGARSRRPSSSSSGCCASAQPTGKTDFAFHRAIAAATNNPFYVEVLDALGSRTIPCDVTSPWGTDSVLTREYQEGLQREHLVILKAISRGDADAARDGHARPSVGQPAALPRAAARPAGRILSARQGAGSRITIRSWSSNDRQSRHTDYTSASPSTRPPPRPWAPTSCAHNFHIGDLFQPGRISLTYTHYDRMIVGGAMPAGAPLPLEAIKPTGTKNFLDRRELIAVNIGGAGTVTADGETLSRSAARDMIYVGMGAQTVSFASDDAGAAGEILSAQRAGASDPSDAG